MKNFEDRSRPAKKPSTVLKRMKTFKRGKVNRGMFVDIWFLFGFSGCCFVRTAKCGRLLILKGMRLFVASKCSVFVFEFGGTVISGSKHGVHLAERGRTVRFGEGVW